MHYDKETNGELNIANSFNTHYKQISTLKQINKKQNKTLHKANDYCNKTSSLRHFTADFNEQELNQALGKLKNKKQPGPDNIHSEFLKHMGKETKVFLLKLFNRIWHGKNEIPALWKKAIIVPIRKPGKPKEELNSYRPVSLTSVTAKVMENMVIARLNYHLETQQLLAEEQSGFTTNSSTIHQIVHLHDYIKEAFNENKSVVALFVDLKNAFDTVWREKLLNKIKTLNIEANMYNWIKDFISQRWTATKWNGKLSKWKQTQAGLPQGTITSPILFNMYINDLAAKIKENKEVQIGMFADDIVIYTAVTNKEHNERNIENKLNPSIKHLCEWVENNNMTINTDKTMYQIFSLKHKISTPDIKINGKSINKSDCTTYLGISLDNKLNLNQHTKNIVMKTTKKMNILKRLSGSTWGSNMDVLNNTYVSYIKPVLKYGGEILSLTNKKNMQTIETCQNRALRIITGAVKTTPIKALLAATNNWPIKDEYELQTIQLYEKLTCNKQKNKWFHRDRVNDKLKTQKYFKTRAEELLPNYPQENNVLSKLPPINPTDYIEITTETSLDEEVCKTTDIPEKLLQITLRTINY